MTRDEILAMEAGRELSILVGKVVLGCYVRKDQTSADHFRYTLVIPGGVDSIDWTTEAGAWSGMPPLSTSWEGMRLIVEAMGKKGYRCVIRIREDGAMCCFYLNDFKLKCENVPADIAPHAVALAALLALEETHA
jgi:hypothetical protein